MKRRLKALIFKENPSLKMKKQLGVSVDQLIKLIPKELIKQLAEKYQVDRYVSKLTGELIFKLLLYSQLEHNQLSLRLMEEAYSSILFQILVPAAKGQVSHGGIQARLKKIPNEFFESLFQHFYEQVRNIYSEPTLKKYFVKRYDSTLVATSAKLLGDNGLRLGTKSSKCNIKHLKFTTGMQGDCLLNIRIFNQQQYTSEDNALGETILDLSHNKEQVVVFDRGLKDRKVFTKLDADLENSPPTYFVTRIYKNSKTTFIKSLSSPEEWQSDTTELVEDSLVYVHTGRHSKKVDTPFRLVKLRRKRDGEIFMILTNMLEETPILITEIYRRRWDIEVLFRFLKQEMNLNHVLCHDQQAMQNVIYVLLITAMMILIYRKGNHIKSYKIAKNRFFKELQEMILLQLVSTPKGAEYLKHILLNRIQKE